MYQRFSILRLKAFFLMLLTCFLASPCALAESPANLWDMDALGKPPKTFDPPDVFSEGYLEKIAEDNIRPIWFEGPPCQGKPTRVFAWYGAPKGKPGQKFPAMVMVHGGGGTANWQWVRYWTKRGYAAIAMDHDGYLPKKGPEHIKNKKGRILNLRTGFSGPEPYCFTGLDKPLRDQWGYHAVASVILSHSLIRSFPEIDPERTGLIGVSWGGYLVNLTVGVDLRFALAISVYGTGFVGEHAVWADRELTALSKADRDIWRKHWNPNEAYLKRNTDTPMLYVTGSNDFAYWLPALKKTVQAIRAPTTLCVRVRMKHGHDGGWKPAENYAFADFFLKQGHRALAKIAGQGRDGGSAWVAWESVVPITKAELCYTRDSGSWPKRHWEVRPAKTDTETTRASAEVPADATAYFFNLTDERGCVVSSVHVDQSKGTGEQDAR